MHLLLKGLNNPVDLKFFSIIFEISIPNLLISNKSDFSEADQQTMEKLRLVEGQDFLL